MNAETAPKEAAPAYLDSEGKFDVKRWVEWAESNNLLPWQMTLEEYSQHLDKDLKPLAQRYPNNRFGGFGIALLEADRLSIKASNMREHERSVRHAHQRGKVIRQEVLAQYGLSLA